MLDGYNVDADGKLIGGIVIQNPSQIFAPNDVLTVDYTAALANQLNTNGKHNDFGQELLTGQTVSMFNSLGPVTGIPTTGLDVTGVLNVTINTLPNSAQDGLTFLNWDDGPTGLQNVTLTGPADSDAPFVFGDGPGFEAAARSMASPMPGFDGGYIPLDFTQAENSFDSTTFAGTVYDLGDGAEARSQLANYDAMISGMIAGYGGGGPATFFSRTGDMTIWLGDGGLNSTYEALGTAGTVSSYSDGTGTRHHRGLGRRRFPLHRQRQCSRAGHPDQ